MAQCYISRPDEISTDSLLLQTHISVSELNAKAAAEIPPYSTLNFVSIGFEAYQNASVLTNSCDIGLRFVNSSGGSTLAYLNHLNVLPKNKWSPYGVQTTEGFITSGKDCGKVSSTINAANLQFSVSHSIPLPRTFKQRNIYVVWDYNPSTFVISLSAGAGGTVQGAGTYAVRSTAVIKAIPNAGYRFVKWSDGNINAERHITVNDNDISANVTNLSYSAVFEPADNDLNYDNLLSIASWKNSANAIGRGSGTATIDTTNGTVKLTNCEGDFYTDFGCGGNFYTFPVEAGQQYLFRYDVQYTGQIRVFVFYYKANNETIYFPDGSFFTVVFDTNELYFTPPAECAKVCIRVGTYSEGFKVNATFSNLAVYKVSWNTHEITNRQYRKVFTVGNELGILYEPERPGYVFQGWYTGENGTGDLIRKIDYNGSRPVLSGNTTVYSHWKKRNYYDVNYDNLFSFSDWAYSPSGAVNGMSDSAYIGTISTDIPNGTVTVKGADPNGSAFYTAYGAFSPYHHIPVVAGQQYAFRYNVSQTYNMQAFVFFCNDNQDFVTDPSTGLPFVFDTNGNDLEFIPPSGCTNVCFRLGVGGINTAVFSNIGLYKVSNEQGITNRPIRKNISYGSAVGTLSTPSKEGYTFKGWYTGESGSGAEIKSSDSFIKGVTAYSAWIKLHTVTFKDENGATLKTEAVADDSTTTPPADPTKADTAQWDYTFDGWYDANGNKWYPNRVITSDTIYTARFTAVVQKYIVRWYNYDGTLLETDADVPYGTKPTYNGSTPTKAGNAEHSYQFAGWNYDTQNGITPSLGTTYIDITAQFTEVDNTYTVEWVNEGKVIETDTLVPYGAKPDYDEVKNGIPTKASDAQYDYTFIGWSTSVSDPAKPESELETVKGNVTYTAVYSATLKLYPIKIILFDTESTQVVEYGTDIVIEAPEVIGYKFTKWTDGNTDNPRTVRVTGEATYQAVYERIPFPIMINNEQVTAVYIVPTTQTIVYVISGEVPTVEIKTDTVDDWNFAVSNSIPDNSYPLEKLYINETRIY